MNIKKTIFVLVALSLAFSLALGGCSKTTLNDESSALQESGSTESEEASSENTNDVSVDENSESSENQESAEIIVDEAAENRALDVVKAFVTALNNGAEDDCKAYMTEEFAEGFKHWWDDSFPELDEFFGKLKASSVKNLTALNDPWTHWADINKQHTYSQSKYLPYSVNIELLNDMGVYEEKVFHTVVVYYSDNTCRLGEFRLSAAYTEFSQTTTLSLQPFLTIEQEKQVLETATEFLRAISMGDEEKCKSLMSKKDFFDSTIKAMMGKIYLTEDCKFITAFTDELSTTETAQKKTVTLLVGFDEYYSSMSMDQYYLRYGLSKYIISISVFDDGKCLIDDNVMLFTADMEMEQ